MSHIELLQLQNQYGVSKKNPYIFGISGRTKYIHLRACNLIRTFAKVCGALNSGSLRGTELRKQLPVP